MKRFINGYSLLLVCFIVGLFSCHQSVDVSPKQAADLATLQKAIFSTKEYAQLRSGINEHLAQVRQQVKLLSADDQAALQSIHDRYTTVNELATKMTAADKATLSRIFSTPLRVNVYSLSNDIERQLAQQYEFTKQDFIKALTTPYSANGKVTQGCADAANDYYWYTFRTLVEDFEIVEEHARPLADALEDSFYRGCIDAGGQP